MLLRFSDRKDLAGDFMDGHNQWLKQGFDDGVFLLAGSLQPAMGGGLLAHNTTFDDLHLRVNEDPFVANNVVSTEIIEITPGKVDDRLGFLID